MTSTARSSKAFIATDASRDRLAVLEFQNEDREGQHERDAVRQHHRDGVDHYSINQPQGDTSAQQHVHAQTDVLRASGTESLESLWEKCRRREDGGGITNPIAEVHNYGTKTGASGRNVPSPTMRSDALLLSWQTNSKL